MSPSARKVFSVIVFTLPFAVAAATLVGAESILGFSLAMAFGICTIISVRLFAISRGFVGLGRKIFFRISMILLMILLFGILVILFCAGRSSGDYRCRICGKQVDRVTYFNIVMETNQPDSPYHTGKDYEEWYWKNVAIEHEHEWDSIGCHFGGGAIICSFEGVGSGFYLFIPQFPDREIAVAMARRIARSPRDERFNLLRAFPESRRNRKEYPEEMSIKEIIAGGGSPWGRILADKQLTREQFKAYYELWLNYHPEWR